MAIFQKEKNKWKEISHRHNAVNPRKQTRWGKIFTAVTVKRHIQIKERIILTASLQQEEPEEKLKETNSPLDSSDH